MAIFSNQATFTYDGSSVDSNVVYGELIARLEVTKTAVEGSYSPGQLVTYVVILRNTGASALTGLTISDDLGGYSVGGMTVYPLTYEPGTIALFVNGVLQPAPAVTAGPPLGIAGITVPAGGDVVLLYQARVNSFANPATGGRIVNTVTVTGGGLGTPVTASETVTAGTEADLTITKSISPAQVAENDRVTYTFVIRNFGNEPVVATDNAVLTDTFDPILTDLVVTYEGTTWTRGVQYNYNETTGLFTTVTSQITVPAATVTRDPVTGAYTVVPGEVTLTVTGTI